MPTDPLPKAVPGQDLEVRGDLVLRDANKVERMRLDSDSGSVFIRNNSGALVCQLEMPGNNLRLGGQGRDADLLLFRRTATSLTDDDAAMLSFDADSGVLRLGAAEAAGAVVLRNAEGNQTLFADGAGGRIVAGAMGQAGALSLHTDGNKRSVFLRGDVGRIEAGGGDVDGEVRLRRADGSTSMRLRAQGGSPGPVATIEVGGNGAGGAINVVSSGGDVVANLNPTGVLSLGTLGGSAVGRLIVNGGSAIGVNLDGRGDIQAGSFTSGGSLSLFRRLDHNAAAPAVIVATADNGTLRVGGGGGADMRGIIDVRDEFDNTTVLIDGQAGDITLANGDMAEEFVAAPGQVIPPGAVLVMDEQQQVRLCDEADDPRVIGVAAGAGTARPAIILGRKARREGATAVALAGRVFCLVDAREEPVSVGDLLTTSPLAGHARKAGDGRTARSGTIVGKAIGSLSGGTGLVPMIVMMH